MYARLSTDVVAPSLGRPCGVFCRDAGALSLRLLDASHASACRSLMFMSSVACATLLSGVLISRKLFHDLEGIDHPCAFASVGCARATGA